MALGGSLPRAGGSTIIETPAAGAAAYGTPFLTLDEVIGEIRAALAARWPFSLVRFGHGEAYVAGHRLRPDRFHPGIDFLPYAGVTQTGIEWERAVLRALAEADIVGLPDGDRPFETPLAREILRRNGIRLPRICSAWIAQRMIESPAFFDLLRGRRLVLVGRRAAEGWAWFAARGLDVVATLPLEGFEGIPPALEAFGAAPEHDLALVSAGVPATIACPRIAARTGAVALDFGHALDYLLDGDAFNHERLVAEFNRTGATTQKGRCSDWSASSRTSSPS